MQTGNSGPFWLMTAALVSLQLAQGRSAEDLDLLAAFFTVIGDNLALLAGELPETAAAAALPQGSQKGEASD